MNKKMLLRASQGKIDIVKKAEKGIESLYQMTKKYESTRESLVRVQTFLRIVRGSYLSNLGNEITKFPYDSKQVRAIFTDAKMIYNFARNKTNKEQTYKHFEAVEKTFTTAQDITKILEEK